MTLQGIHNILQPIINIYKLQLGLVEIKANYQFQLVIEDAGKSGKDLKREGIQDLLVRIRNKSIDALVVYRLDRLSRKVIDTIIAI